MAAIPSDSAIDRRIFHSLSASISFMPLVNGSSAYKASDTRAAKIVKVLIPHAKPRQPLINSTEIGDTELVARTRMRHGECSRGNAQTEAELVKAWGIGRTAVCLPSHN